MSASSDARSKAVQAALQRQLAVVASPPTSPSSSASSSTDPLRSLIIFVVGAPGCGKSTQCAALASNLSFHHVQFDHFLRQAIRYADDKAKKRSSTTSSSSSRASSSTFVPSLSSSQLSTLLRAHQTKQPIPSSIRARLLYSAMQQLSHTAPLFRFLVDGYLDSEDDWNEWAALVRKRQSERLPHPAPSTSSSTPTSSTTPITFLPPIIIRLVCSESVGQLRWRRQLLLHTDSTTSPTTSPTTSTNKPSTSSSTTAIADVKARSMKYSLRTRPLIYRLGMVAEEKAWHDAEEGDEEGEEEGEDEDALAVMDGMIVKRVDAEGPIDACYADMEALVRAIIAHTQDDDWTRITGYDTDEEEGGGVVGGVGVGGGEGGSTLASVSSSAASSASATPALTIRPAPSTPVPSLTAPSLPLSITGPTIPPQPSPNLLSPPSPQPPPDESDSPVGVNWQEDPAEALERAEAEREELDRLQRTQRMLRLIEAEELKWAEEAEREEAREKRRMDDEIARLREREELVEAEQGHIRTRRDDRFVTFISTSIAVSIVQGVKEGDGMVWVEVYRGVGGAGGGGEGAAAAAQPQQQPQRWLRVAKTAKLPVTSLSIAFPRLIVNTWKLSGNERERPVMFRLFHSPPSPACLHPLPPPQPLNSSVSRALCCSTCWLHLRRKGLTLTLRSHHSHPHSLHLPSPISSSPPRPFIPS